MTKEIEKPGYTFEHAGNTYTVPNFADLKIGVLRRARKEVNEMDMAFSIIENSLGEGPELNAVDDMSTEEFQAWLAGLTQGANLGESSGSGK